MVARSAAHTEKLAQITPAPRNCAPNGPSWTGFVRSRPAPERKRDLQHGDDADYDSRHQHHDLGTRAEAVT
jgi:hypothetical protein